MRYKTKFEQWYNKQSVQLILDGCEISPFMKDQITNVLTHRSPTYDQWKNFAYWVKYNVNDDFVQRYDRFSTFSKRDSSKFGSCFTKVFIFSIISWCNILCSSNFG